MVQNPKKSQARPSGKRVSSAEIKLIRNFHEQGKKNSWISKTLKISDHTIRKWINRDPDDLEQKFSAGRPATLNTPEVRRVLRETQAKDLFNTCTVAQFRAKATKKRKKGSNVHTALTTMSETTFRRTYESEGLKAAKTLSKPIGMVLNCAERLTAAKRRKRWTNKFTRGIIWIDQSCGQRSGGDRCMVREGQERTVALYPDPKEEKVHFLIGIGNGWKSPFEHLPVRRPVQKDAKTGKTVHRTAATGRRAKGTTDEERADNKKKNQANEGETWTAAKVTDIVTGDDWLQHLLKATGVVLDAQRGFHKSVVEALREHGVNVIDHPAHSPDMNLIELVHGSVKNRNSVVVQRAANNEELLAAYEENWANYPLETFDNIVGGMDNTLRRIVAKKGGPSGK